MMASPRAAAVLSITVPGGSGSWRGVEPLGQLAENGLVGLNEHSDPR